MTTQLRQVILLLAVFFTAQFASAHTHSDGFSAMQLEQWDKAIEIYSAIVKTNPADQPALLTLGSIWLAKGDKEKAKQNFEAAFAAKPEGAMAFIANGRIMLLQGNTAEADKQFAKAAKYGKKDVVALRLIGESYLYDMPGVKPNFAKAEEGLKAALDVSSKDVTTIMTLGYCYKEMPNGGLAAQQYELAESLEPKNPLIKYMLAKVYKAAKLNDRFLLYVDKAIAVDPHYTPALRAKAEYLYYDRKWEQATQAYKDLVNNGKEVTIEDEMQLANTLFITKDYKGCSDLVERIIKKDGSKNYLRRLLAYCSYETGDYARGLEVLTDYFKHVTPDKELASDFLYMGRLQVKTKSDTLAAIENLKKGIRKDSSQWAVYKEIGELYYTKKKNLEAAQAYTMYLDSVPKPDPTDLYKLGLAQFYSKEDSLRFVKSEKTFAKIAELVPKAGLGWLWAGKSAARQDPDINAHPELVNEFGKAKPYFEKYIEIGSTDPVKNKKDLIGAYEYLTYYYYNKADVAEVKAYAAKLLELDPTNPTGMELMKAAESGSIVPTSPKPQATPVATPTGGGKG